MLDSKAKLAQWGHRDHKEALDPQEQLDLKVTLGRQVRLDLQALRVQAVLRVRKGTLALPVLRVLKEYKA
jgi:hypothetical protein